MKFTSERSMEDFLYGLKHVASKSEDENYLINLNGRVENNQFWFTNRTESLNFLTRNSNFISEISGIIENKKNQTIVNVEIYVKKEYYKEIFFFVSMFSIFIIGLTLFQNNLQAMIQIQFIIILFHLFFSYIEIYFSKKKLSREFVKTFQLTRFGLTIT